MAEAAGAVPQRSTVTRVASDVKAGMRVMRRRQVHKVVGAIRTSSANYSITTRPEDDPAADLEFWVGHPDTEWTVVQ